MKKYKRIFVIVMDSPGSVRRMMRRHMVMQVRIRSAISRSAERNLLFRNLQKIGMANLHPVKQVAPVEHPLGYYMEMKERSAGKDTMTGHWELMGLYTQTLSDLFTEHGFRKG